MILHLLRIFRRLTTSAALCVTFACVAVTTASAQEAAPDVYRNARFGFSICYPGKLLIPQQESENGDGRKFLAKDGAELLVWGENNTLNNSISQQKEDTITSIGQEAGTVTYETARADWFVISGEIRGRIYYQKTIRGGDQFASYRLTYDRANAKQYEPMIQTFGNCFGY